MDESFYVLIEGSSSRLPLPLSLRNWEIALVTYKPPVFNNFAKSYVDVQDEHGKRHVTVQGGYFGSLPAYVDHLNQCIGSNKIVLKYLDHGKQITVSISGNRTSLKLSKYLADKLGLPSGTLRKSLTGTGPVVASDTYICTSNVVSPSLIGDSFQDAIYVFNSSFTVDHLIYVPAKNQLFDEISVELKLGNGNVVAGTGGQVAVIHFRKRQQDLREMPSEYPGLGLLPR